MKTHSRIILAGYLDGEVCFQKLLRKLNDGLQFKDTAPELRVVPCEAAALPARTLSADTPYSSNLKMSPSEAWSTVTERCAIAAFDKGDLLYLRDEEEKRRFAEQELRESELRSFARMRQKTDALPDDLDPGPEISGKQENTRYTKSSK